jgi:hypothetical protein
MYEMHPALSLKARGVTALRATKRAVDDIVSKIYEHIYDEVMQG